MAVENTENHGISHRMSNAAIGSHARPQGQPLAMLGGHPLLSNRGIALNLDWVQQVRVNTSAVERRAQSHTARRSVKKEWQAAWLLRAITCMDLTTLSGDDTDERVRRLCAESTGVAAMASLSAPMTRSRISPAALRVNVMATISSGRSTCASSAR